MFPGKSRNRLDNVVYIDMHRKRVTHLDPETYCNLILPPRAPRKIQRGFSILLPKNALAIFGNSLKISCLALVDQNNWKLRLIFKSLVELDSITFSVKQIIDTISKPLAIEFWSCPDHLLQKLGIASIWLACILLQMRHLWHFPLMPTSAQPCGRLYLYRTTYRLWPDHSHLYWPHPTDGTGQFSSNVLFHLRNSSGYDKILHCTSIHNPLDLRSNVCYLPHNTLRHIIFRSSSVYWRLHGRINFFHSRWSHPTAQNFWTCPPGNKRNLPLYPGRNRGLGQLKKSLGGDGDWDTKNSRLGSQYKRRHTLPNIYSYY